jgi:poly(A) polymerase
MSFLSETSVIPLLYKLASSRKQKLFLVGGALRDVHLGRSGHDLDFAVSRDAIALARRFAKAIRGAFVLLDKESGCARVAKKRADGLWTYDFADFRAKTLKGDLARRDFTINTLAVDLKYILHDGVGAGFTPPRLISHAKALSDLKSKIIRMAGPKAFKDDPLRLLRAYSLKAQLGFKIDPSTLACIKVQRALIKKVSAERVRE